AKQEEEIFLPGKTESIRLPYDSPALYLIQRMRDEAHRFTITYHRSLRSKEHIKSALDEVPGIGPKTKKLLIKTFGSVKGIKSASDEELEKVIGVKKTKVLREHL
ncbi:MAG TPA: helix-hairpin-helix domain-containing protein, partial [Candidatus Andersenbacteria bacterium]|nr:helix-hairpin-helix domain-containing protein [Candidatus Andersenbacteria bacterium]